MADTTYYRFVLKRDTAANFTAKNTLLLAGEFGLETDTGKLKLSLDGTTYWNSLAYFGVGAGGVNRQTGTSYTFGTGDVDQSVICTNAAAVTVTIPTNATAPIAIGAKIAYTQGGAGQLTIAGASGVTVRAPNGSTTGAVYDGGVAEKIGTDEWQLWNGPALGAMALVADAPSDGTPYSRQSGAWVAAGAAPSRTMNEQTGTSYTPVIGDVNKDFRCTNASAITFIIPTHASVALPLCTPYVVFQGGAGIVTVSGASGVTIESPFGAATTAIKDFRVIYQRATDVWVIG